MTVQERLKHANPMILAVPAAIAGAYAVTLERVAEETRKACLSVLIQ